MRVKIGEIAGEIWKILREKEEVNVVQLPRMLKEKTFPVYQALGWLACEGKILYRVEGEKVFVSLTEAEKN